MNVVEGSNGRKGEGSVRSGMKGRLIEQVD